MGEYVDKVLTRVEETPAEELPAPSPITPERGVVDTTLGVPRRRQPNPPVATPPPVQVQAPPPLPPLFVDTMRAWMKQEEAKRKEAEEEATKAKEDLIAVKLDLAEADKQWGLWEKSTKQAWGLLKTLSRFILALDKGLKLAWDRNAVATFTQEPEPGETFKATFVDAFSKKLNDKVDYFNAASMKPKTQVRQTPERDPGGPELDD